jgi:hypothetical protein
MTSYSSAMHYLVLIALLILPALCVSQPADDSSFYASVEKHARYYVRRTQDEAIVYTMGSYAHPLGKGYSIRRIDTLQRQGDRFVGKELSVEWNNNEGILRESGRKKATHLVPDDRAMVNLNNGYFLDTYFKMSDDLNLEFPLAHHWSLTGFEVWERIGPKDMSHQKFKLYADKRIKTIRDSLAIAQNRYVANKDFLLKNLSSLDYPTLRDSISQLPPDLKPDTEYFALVVTELARTRPSDYLTYVEENPAKRDALFINVQDDDRAVTAIRNVDGHKVSKKQFLKERRSGKLLTYGIGTTLVVIGGVLAWVMIE